jgi:hypothetical protein
MATQGCDQSADPAAGMAGRQQVALTLPEPALAPMRLGVFAPGEDRSGLR